MTLKLCVYVNMKILRSMIIYMCVPVTWKIDLNPRPNLPTFSGFSFLTLCLTIVMPFQSSSVNNPSL